MALIGLVGEAEEVADNHQREAPEQPYRRGTTKKTVRLLSQLATRDIKTKLIKTLHSYRLINK